MIDKGDFAEFPIIANVTNAPGYVQASFSLIKEHLTVSGLFGSWVPQSVWDIFTNQECAPAGTYTPEGYNFVLASSYYCSAEDDIIPCANVAPSLSWCSLTCDFPLMQTMNDCFSALAQKACDMVKEEQHDENVKTGLIIGGTAAGLCLAGLACYGIFRAKSSKATDPEKQDLITNSESNTKTYTQ